MMSMMAQMLNAFIVPFRQLWLVRDKLPRCCSFRSTTNCIIYLNLKGSVSERRARIVFVCVYMCVCDKNACILRQKVIAHDCGVAHTECCKSVLGLCSLEGNKSTEAGCTELPGGGNESWLIDSAWQLNLWWWAHKSVESASDLEKLDTAGCSWLCSVVILHSGKLKGDLRKKF